MLMRTLRIPCALVCGRSRAGISNGWRCRCRRLSPASLGSGLPARRLRLVLKSTTTGNCTGSYLELQIAALTCTPSLGLAKPGVLCRFPWRLLRSVVCLHEDSPLTGVASSLDPTALPDISTSCAARPEVPALRPEPPDSEARLQRARTSLSGAGVERRGGNSCTVAPCSSWSCPQACSFGWIRLMAARSESEPCPPWVSRTSTSLGM
eukprot:scaffold124266_cov33-Tisochrysis_lutea.AAC.2